MERRRFSIDLFASSPLARRYLVWAMLLGLVYTVINPPFAVNDEREHWLRTLEIVKGRARSRNDQEGAYHSVRQDYYDLIMRYGQLQKEPATRVDPHELFRDLTSTRGKHNWKRRPSNASGYTPISYLPHIPAVWLASVLRLPPLWQVYFGRVASFTSSALLIAFAVSVSGRLGWLFATLGLMPMVLTQASGLSGDTLTNAFAFVFFALVAKGALDKDTRLTDRELTGLVLLNAALTLCKPVYVLVFFALPALRWEGSRTHLKRWGFTVASAASAVFLEFLWMYVNRNSSATDNSAVGSQLGWITSHPVETLGVAAVTLIERGDDYLMQLVAVRDLVNREMRFLGGVTSAAYTSLLVFVALGAAWDPRNTVQRRWTASLLILTVLGIVGAVFAAMYLAVNAVGAAVIVGVQGRYFIPVMPAVLVALAAVGRPIAARWLTAKGGRRVLACVAGVNAFCLCALFARYYLPSGYGWPY